MTPITDTQPVGTPPVSPYLALLEAELASVSLLNASTVAPPATSPPTPLSPFAQMLAQEAQANSGMAPASGPPSSAPPSVLNPQLLLEAAAINPPVAPTDPYQLLGMYTGFGAPVAPNILTFA